MGGERHSNPHFGKDPTQLYNCLNKFNISYCKVCDKTVTTHKKKKQTHLRSHIPLVHTYTVNGIILKLCLQKKTKKVTTEMPCPWYVVCTILIDNEVNTGLVLFCVFDCYALNCELTTQTVLEHNI